IELACESSGIPTPKIKWKFNGVDIINQFAVEPNGELVIENSTKNDTGVYRCEAENEAGSDFKNVHSNFIVESPRISTQTNLEPEVLNGHTTILLCQVEGHPPPKVQWLKNGYPVDVKNENYIFQDRNQHFEILQTTVEDSGDYSCIAKNEAGIDDLHFILNVLDPPKFKIPPTSITADQSATVTFDCVAEGEPEPEVHWLSEDLMKFGDRFSILSNNSLRIVAVQVEDEDVYECRIANKLGTNVAYAVLTVQVHGQFSQWTDWSDCSASCGDGLQTRSRTCTNPAPRNGGRACAGSTAEERTCMPRPCPVDGMWSDWSAWTECSQSCGDGLKTRVRDCSNPHPKYEGRHCNGEGMERVLCNAKPCPVHGGWGQWTEWDKCSEPCGEGQQQRHRECDSPVPKYSGDYCSGMIHDKRACKIADCEVNGNWGSWTEWSSCTLSCGGGMRKRERRCDNPPPSNDGKFCPGSDQQIDYCNKEECPVHGKWAEWSAWGDCTLTCGGGQRRRFRTCTNPVPKHNGRACIGVAQETDVCNHQRCAVDGEWSTWSMWTACSRTCDGGTQERRRVCRQPEYGGLACVGDPNQLKKCNTHPCEAKSLQSARASVRGMLNSQAIDAKLVAEVDREPTHGVVTVGKITDLPTTLVQNFKPLLSILAPIYWSTALQVGKVANGFSLTRGEFQQISNVEFMNGELTIEQIAHGIDNEGMLTYDVTLTGSMLNMSEADGNISFVPFTEDYVQTGRNTLYAQSYRSYQLGDSRMPYKWNHTITYNLTLNKMPFLVQQLTIESAEVTYDPANNTLQFIVVSHVSKGEPSNQCPRGFILDPEEAFCADDNECTTLQMCSHFCTNTIGSYVCTCPSGFKLDIDGRNCNDIDECEAGDDVCDGATDSECINTVGSFKCLPKCLEGHRRSLASFECQDINECLEIPNLCSQLCTNLPGSFVCSCKTGYKLSSKSKCEDIDECTENLDNCVPGQVCRNRPGGFTCVNTCPTGFNLHANGSCIDVDECMSATGFCTPPQKCLNTIGSYVCICPKGFKKSNNKLTCIDLNECSIPNICQHDCQNVPGSYRCLCPPGYRLTPDERNCSDINECKEHSMACDPDKQCFNKLGGHECIELSCPPKYFFDPSSKFCMLNCDECSSPHTLQFHLISLPLNFANGSGIIRLTVNNQDGLRLGLTSFNITSKDTASRHFNIRVENGVGVVYSKQTLMEPREYKLKVESKSIDPMFPDVKFQTRFTLFIHVSKYTFS
ncbi:hypothetical protein HELRODRAFT_89118, partial [Helobdella robusta]|uniref:Hemicentin-1 n=1 Tax=Helobdella robusta TaxID=6412 RepID=T1G789_HELRO